MTQALNDAIRAGQAELNALAQPGTTITIWSLAEKSTLAAVAAALPAKPSAELIEAVEDAIRESMSIDIDERLQALAAYFAIRAAILGEDA